LSPPTYDIPLRTTHKKRLPALALLPAFVSVLSYWRIGIDPFYFTDYPSKKAEFSLNYLDNTHDNCPFVIASTAHRPATIPVSLTRVLMWRTRWMT
jgi:hypothetical protein